ncbi:MAG: hypothetical protein JOY61_08890, partial [Chloroflexi bacterium]|nr:hypothetical protein [Chloroflexota bacterium]
MGPALGIASLLGTVICTWRLLRGDAREREALLVVLWAVLNLAYFGGQFAKFLRYLEPAYFALAILAAYALLLGTAYLARFHRWGLDTLRPWLAPAVVAATACWALAFSSIYDQPHSRIQASNWIYANIPAGATLATEHWDDRLPLGRPGENPNRYRYAELTLYDPETPAKRASLEAALDQSDYVILASRRLADSIPRLPERYPMATAYYRMLQDGQLGFQRVARFQVAPGLGPLLIDDSHAQEDFTVYDHPLVEVWAKQSNYSSANVRQLLGAIPIDQAVNVRPIDGGKGALLQTPAERAAQLTAGTWSDMFHPGDWVNQWSALVWLFAAEALAFSSVPLLWWSLRFLPDRGFAASKILGLAFVAYVAWLIASLKIAPFQRPLLVGAWLLLVCLSIAATWRQRALFKQFLAQERRLLITTEVVFLAGFALFLFIRAANPDLWQVQYGGEKPMNFAYLNAVTKSDYFPPYDPWFSGGIINYYYYGFVLVATLIKLTGIMPEIAFNLAQPTLFGALCAGVFSIAFALSVPVRGRVGRGAAYLAGVAAALMTGILGNLDAGLQLLDQLAKLGSQVAPQSAGVARVGFGVWAVVLGMRFPPLDFWRSTRFIGPEDPGPIHEFPYFTFLYGDLHAHQLALPLTVAVVAVGINVMRSLRANPRRVPWVSLLIAGVLVGMLRATNTWDFPTYAAVSILMLVIGVLPALLRFDRRAVQTLLASAVVFGVSMLLSFWPYLQRYQLFYTGIDPVKARTALSQYLTIHGLFLFVGVSLLAWYLVLARRRVLAVRRERALVPEPGYYGMILPLGSLNGYATLPAWIAGAGTLLALVAALAGYPTRALIVFLIGATLAVAVGTRRRPNQMLQAALFGIALFATLIPEFVALRGDIGRMNTVFKFYLQAWVMLSIVAAVALGWLSRRSVREPLLRMLRPAWIALAVILFVAAVSYPLFASEGKIGLRFVDLPLSLNGMDYMQFAQYSDQNRDLNLPGDYAAIRWMQANITGTPVILEGRSPIYRWGSRVSIYTGLPTILGWDWHQTQQRSGDNGAGYAGMIQERAQDVERAYASPDPEQALSVLRKYDVQWVYVGGLERAYYPAVGLDKLRDMPELHLVYDANGVQIYQVVQ